MKKRSGKFPIQLIYYIKPLCPGPFYSWASWELTTTVLQCFDILIDPDKKMQPDIGNEPTMEAYTLNNVTASGHVKYQENPLACKLHARELSMENLLLSLIFIRPVITKHDKWSYKSPKRDWPCILHGHSK